MFTIYLMSQITSAERSLYRWYNSFIPIEENALTLWLLFYNLYRDLWFGVGLFASKVVLDVWFQILVVVVLSDPFREMEAWRNSTKTQQLGHAQDLDQRSKMEEVVPKMARRRGLDTGQSRRRWVRSCKGCPQALFQI